MTVRRLRLLQCRFRPPVLGRGLLFYYKIKSIATDRCPRVPPVSGAWEKLGNRFRESCRVYLEDDCSGLQSISSCRCGATFSNKCLSLRGTCHVAGKGPFPQSIFSAAGTGKWHYLFGLKLFFMLGVAKNAYSEFLEGVSVWSIQNILDAIIDSLNKSI